MRIACIGNMNNMMFTLCRYLRDNGYDANLFCFKDEAVNFLPGTDSFDENYLEYTINLNVSRNDLFDQKIIEQVQSDLKEYDFLIGNDYAPALVLSIGRKLNIFVPHGSDIYAYPFNKIKNKEVNNVWWTNAVYSFGKLQKLGIQYTDMIIFPDEYEKNIPFKAKLKAKGVFHGFTIPMLYIPQYQLLAKNNIPTGLNFAADFLAIRSKFDLMVFSHSRHNGINLPKHHAIHYKGNDVIIKGFSRYIKENNKNNSCLVLFDYGMDVAASKSLVEELEIQDFVFWMPKMSRKEIMFGLSLADVSCGQLGGNSWLTSGVINESLALDKPIIHYRDDSMYVEDYEELYPILRASNENEFEKQLIYFSQNKNAAIKEALKGSAWLEKYTVQYPMKVIKQNIDSFKFDKLHLNFLDQAKLGFIRIENKLIKLWYAIVFKAKNGLKRH